MKLLLLQNFQFRFSWQYFLHCFRQFPFPRSFQPIRGAPQIISYLIKLKSCSKNWNNFFSCSKSILCWRYLGEGRKYNEEGDPIWGARDNRKRKYRSEKLIYQSNCQNKNTNKSVVFLLTLFLSLHFILTALHNWYRL